MRKSPKYRGKTLKLMRQKWIHIDVCGYISTSDPYRYIFRHHKIKQKPFSLNIKWNATVSGIFMLSPIVKIGYKSMCGMFFLYNVMGHFFRQPCNQVLACGLLTCIIYNGCHSWDFLLACKPRISHNFINILSRHFILHFTCT